MVIHITIAHMLYEKGRTILVRVHYEAAVQEEFFFLDEHGRLDLSEVGLLVATPIYEADSDGIATGVLECDAAEMSIKSFPVDSQLDVTAASGSLVHAHQCGGCGVNPVEGPRHTCVECSFPFSLCHACYTSATYTHEHISSSFVQLDKVVYSSMWLGGATLSQTIMNVFNNYGPLPCIGYQDRDYLAYKWLTYSEVKSRFVHFASGIHNLRPSKLGLYTTNKVEWIISDLACVYASCVVVYIPYPTGNADTESLISLVNESAIDTIVCESSLQILEISNGLPLVRHLVQIDPISANESSLAASSHIKLACFSDLEAVGSRQKMPPMRSPDSNLSSLVYTSGSTGMPKGVMFTAGAMNSSLKSSMAVIEGGRIVLLEYLPLSHTRAAYRHCCMLGGQYALYNKGLVDLFSVSQVVNPTRFRGVPLVWNKLYMEYQSALMIAVKTGLSEEKAKTAVLTQFSSILGNRIVRVSTGSAPTSVTVLNFLKECFKDVVDAYGCTEVGSISGNQRVVKNSEFKLVDCDELGYRTTDQPHPRGEVAVRTQDMSCGYYKNEAANASCFTSDGFFLTGDIAELRDDQLVIIDRKKNFFKLANGKFVRCEYLENLYMKSNYIHQMFITGDPLRDYVVAVVVPSSSVPKDDAKELVMNQIIETSVEYKLANHEIPKALILEAKPFSVEEGTLTPTFKKARVALNAKYKSQVDSLYDSTGHGLNVTKEILKADILLGILSDTLGYQLENDRGDDNKSSFFGATSDSLSKVLLISQIKNIFSKDISIGTAFSSLSLENLAKLVSSPYESPKDEQFYKDLNLPLPAVPPQSSSYFDLFDKSDRTPRTLFMTGATGFVGAFLLSELLRRTSPDFRFLCLVRGDKVQKIHGDAKQPAPKKLDDSEHVRCRRVLAILQKYHINVDAMNMEERVEEIEGDLGIERFGLDERSWERIAQVDAIVHCAASVNWALSYQEVRTANVLGTLQVIQLATHMKVKPILFVSTLSVANEFNNTSLPSLEEFTQSKPFKRQDGYVISKWMAEYLIRNMADRGLPVLLVRPGMVTGHSTEGAVHESQFIARLLRGIASMRAAPRSRALLTDMSPVDFVATACAHLFRTFLREPSALGDSTATPTFHLWNDRYACFDDITACFAEYGLPAQVMTYDDWITRIRGSDSRSNPLYALLPFLPEKDRGDVIGIRNQQMKTIHEYCNNETIPVLDKSVHLMLLKMLSYLTK